MPKRETTSRRALLDSAVILLTENPGASFIEVAKKASIGRATLYRHFSTREDLIHALSLESIEATDRTASDIMNRSTTATEALYLMLESMISLGDRYCFLIRLPELGDEKIDAEMNRQNDELRQLIEAAQEEGGIDPTLPPLWISSVFNGLIYTAWDSLSRGELREADLKVLITRTFKRGLQV
jgi:AcrR family transcriptional regulator